MVAPAAVMAKLEIWSLWGCAACVEKELNEGTCLFVNFILPARGAAPGVRSRGVPKFIDIDPA